MELISAKEAIEFIALSFVTIIGIAGFGYIVNDLSDKDQDQKAGKPNHIGQMSALNTSIILVIMLGLAFSPWLVFPTDTLSFVLLSTEVCLFIVYSLPPFRLKEKGLLGVVCDSLYAHVVPTTLALYTFYLIGHNEIFRNTYLILPILVWQFVLGIRNILYHQTIDYENDIESGTKTYITMKGDGFGKRWIKNLQFIESILLACFLSFFAFEYHWLPLFIFLLHKSFMILKIDDGWKLNERLYHLSDNFNLHWLPIIFLALLIGWDLSFLWLLLIHLLFFDNVLKHIAVNLYSRIK